jgi:hypothetical protein
MLRPPSMPVSVSGVRPAVSSMGTLAWAALSSPQIVLAVPTLTWTITACALPLTIQCPIAMCTATFSCGTVTGLGTFAPSIFALT